MVNLDTSEHRLTLSEVLRLLASDGVIGQVQIDELLTEHPLQRRDLHPLVIIAEQNFKSQHPPHRSLNLETLTEWLAKRTGLGYLHIDPLKIDFSAVTEIMSGDYATRFDILPIQVTSDEVVVATAEPFLREWEQILKHLLRKKIRRVIATPLDINRYQVEFYSLARSVKTAAQIKLQDKSGLSSFEQLVEMGKANRQFDANDQHIIRIVDWLWQYAFEQRASDIHIEPRRDLGIIRFRIDGILHQAYQIPMSVMTAMTSRIKLLGRMDVVEKRRPQDGRIKTRSADGQEIELRLSTLPTVFGEKLVMRVFDPDVLVRDFSDLGFSQEDQIRWKQMTGQPNGIILVTGPTGSGKTTTLYSTLKQLATSEVNVCTIEDPIEMVEPAFNQMQVQSNLDIDFSNGLRTLMRQDPDIIMVGEIRDLETAEMAIQAALTGHLVLSTLHTNDAPSAITRLLNLGVAPYLINSTLLGVLAQRLVRTLCPHCKQAQEMDASASESWDSLTTTWHIPKPTHIHHQNGCLECRMTGYLGRIGIYESLLLTPALRNCVTAGADLAEMHEISCKEGMKPLRISGAMKVAAGMTTLEEIFKVAPMGNGK